MKSVDEIVAILSPAEREKHKYLIAECRAREAGIAQESVRAVTAIGQALKSQAEYIKIIGRVEESVAQLQERLGPFLLRMIPDDKCHKS